MSDKGVKKPVVVVADDDVEILTLVSRTLRRLGLEVHEANDGEEALKTIRQVRPVMVVLDVMMPGMSGWEVCRALRDDQEIADTGVLMLTGIGERLNEMTSPLYGADDHLDKPFDFDELEQRVTAMLEKKTKKS
ncbi:MAG: response regulator [Deltaproteobacteria bacterium]|nr:response regulator [Deltaproteobacteria bacterium]